MKVSEIRALSDDQIYLEIDQMVKERLALRIKIANSSQGENVNRLSKKTLQGA